MTRYKVVVREQANIQFDGSVSLDFTIPGLTLIKGDTGSGKSTLLQIVAGIIPHLSPQPVALDYYIGGVEANFDAIRDSISFAFQEPEKQFLLNTLGHQLLFSTTSHAEYTQAVELLDQFGISADELATPISKLSTGQRKIVSLLPTLVSQKNLLIFDEPTANLDSARKQVFVRLLRNHLSSRAVLVSSHDSVFDAIASRTVSLGSNAGTTISPQPISSSGVCLEADALSYMYPSGREFDFPAIDVARHAITGIVGPNGAGKTTFLYLLAGMLSSDAGSVRRPESFSFVFQEPFRQICCSTVREELLLGGTDISSEPAQEILSLLGVDGLLSEHIYFLSRGQQQLILLGAGLLSDAELVFLDEPFTGLDGSARARAYRAFCYALENCGKTLVVTGHGEYEGLYHRTIRISSP